MKKFLKVFFDHFGFGKSVLCRLMQNYSRKSIVNMSKKQLQIEQAHIYPDQVLLQHMVTQLKGKYNLRFGEQKGM